MRETRRNIGFRAGWGGGIGKLFPALAENEAEKGDHDVADRGHNREGDFQFRVDHPNGLSRTDGMRWPKSLAQCIQVLASFGITPQQNGHLRPRWGNSTVMRQPSGPRRKPSASPSHGRPLRLPRDQPNSVENPATAATVMRNKSGSFISNYDCQNGNGCRFETSLCWCFTGFRRFIPHGDGYRSGGFDLRQILLGGDANELGNWDVGIGGNRLKSVRH